MSKYAKLLTNLSYLSNIMYHIIVDNQTVQSLNSEQVAYANYRALCRDYKNKSSSIKLMLDDKIVHEKLADLQLLNNIDKITTNDMLKLVMQKLDIDVKQLKSAIKETDLQLSNSRIDGWVKKSDDRKFTQMHNDELYVVIDTLLNQSQQTIKTPENIVKMREKLGFTQSQLAESLGMKATHRQVARWEAGEAEMPYKKWNLLLSLLK